MDDVAARDWTFVVDVVLKRLGMYAGRATYEQAVALVAGFDLAQVERIHPRLQARVSARNGSGSIWWPRVLLVEALGDAAENVRGLGPLTPEQDERAIELLAAEIRATVTS